MRQRTVILFGFLLAVVMAAVIYLQSHQTYLLHVKSGSMSLATKKKFWALNIDCQEVYEVQGYESPESIYKMFSLSQHAFYQLNPGTGMILRQGDILCVKGVFDISVATMTTPWFWPAAMLALLVGVGAVAYARMGVKGQQQGHG